MSLLARVGGLLVQRQRGLLVLLLAMLHFPCLQAPEGVRHGLVAGRRRPVHALAAVCPCRAAPGFSSLSSFLLILAAGIWGYGDWLLLLWTAFVAALVGGRVLFVSHRATRIFYLLAFAYLLVAVLFISCRAWYPIPALRASCWKPSLFGQAGPHCRDAVDAAYGDGRAQGGGARRFRLQPVRLPADRRSGAG